MLVPALLIAQVPATYKAIKFPPMKQVKIPKVEEATLSNGMKVYLLENHELPLVSGIALVRTGNLFDPADKVGLASITGGVMRSGGTSKKSGDAIDEELENIAASVESQIGESFGTVSFSMLKEQTDQVMGIFHDVLTDPAFREDKLALTKTQLRSGIARRNDDARSVSHREFTDLLYGRGTPYGWEMQYATVDNISRNDLVDFYRRYYFPANVILAVQGDFAGAEMKARLERLFGGWNAKESLVPPFPKVVSEAKAGTYLAVKTDVTQTNFMMGQMGGTLRDKDYPALQVMADILGGGFRSRLFQKVRTQLGYAYDISADWGANYDHPGLFEISGSTKSASTTEALLAARAEVEKIRSLEVTGEELETAKQTVVNSFVFNFDTPSKTLNRLITYRYFGYPDDFIFDYQKKVAAVTRADILRVAKEYLDPAKMIVVAVGNPAEMKKPLRDLGMPVSEIDLTIPDGKPTASAAKPNFGLPGAPEYPEGMLEKKPALAMLARLQNALGGAEALRKVRDFEITSDAQVAPSAGGLKVTQTNQFLLPGTFRQENVLPFGKVISYYDSGAGWLSTPQGLMGIQASQGEQIEVELFRNWFSLALSDRVKSRTLKVDDGKLVIADGKHSVALTLDERGLPLKQAYSLSGAPVEEEYSDWRETDGVRLPYKVTVTQKGLKYLDATVKTVKFNVGLTKEKMGKQP